MSIFLGNQSCYKGTQYSHSYTGRAIIEQTLHWVVISRPNVQLTSFICSHTLCTHGLCNSNIHIE